VAVVLALGTVLAASGPWPVPASAQDRSTSGTAPAATTAEPGADLGRLRERVAAFWAARIEGDAKAQWELLEPRGRGRLTPAEYVAGPGVVRYLGYQVEDASVEGYFATVKVRLLVHTILPSRQQQRIQPRAALVSDRWVRIGGIWYRSLEQQEAAEPTREAGG
jgi:hypothetical protein